MSEQISIDVVSDVVCPWCYVGQKKLERAIASAPDLDVTVNWRPYQLDSTIPAGGMDRKQYMLAKFGSQERIDRIHERIEGIGRDVGIGFRFDAIAVAANTMDAHRVIRWAANGGSDMQNQVVKALFAANFEQGRDIGAPDVLIDIARENGMDTPVVEALLATDSDSDAVRQEIEMASRMGITGVPCFLLDGRYALMGAQEPEAIVDALRKIVAARIAQ